MRMNALAGLAGLLAIGVHHGSADAVTCDTLDLSNTAEDVVIGEAGYEYWFGTLGWAFKPYATRRLGACVTLPDGTQHMYVLACTTAHVTGDVLSLSTRGGDDRVAVLQEEHTDGDMTLLPAFDTGAMYCGDDGDAIAPWNPDFDFGIIASLGTGTDLFHGSDNADTVHTNALVFQNGVISAPADSSTQDLACGWGGNDRLFGDRDDQWTSGIEDHLGGGAGTDTCDGDPFVDGNDSSDVSSSCESSADAFINNSNTIFDCADSDDPLHEW